MGESERAADSEVSTSDPTESTSDVVETTSDPAVNGPPSLGSRILITWVSLTAVGVVGGLLSSAVQGPVGFVIYLAVTLASVAVLLYNVNELVKGWVAASQAESMAD
ncbi:MAG: hypothetical protein ABEH81_05510 [Halopenitus sp.]